MPLGWVQSLADADFRGWIVGPEPGGDQSGAEINTLTWLKTAFTLTLDSLIQSHVTEYLSEDCLISICSTYISTGTLNSL